MYHIAFYVPVSHAERVKEKMFQAGAGKIGNYDQCSFEYKGIGQFRSLPGSTPFVGTQEQVEQLEELKIEMVCTEESLVSAITALKEAHPYETPAYYVIKVVGI